MSKGPADRRIRAACFDFDGVFGPIKASEEYFWRFFNEQTGHQITPSTWITTYSGLSEQATYEALRRDFGVCDDAIRETFSYYRRKRTELEASSYETIPGMQEVAEQLVGDGVKIAVVSNSLVADVHVKIQKGGLTHLFNAEKGNVISGAEHGFKPLPNVIHEGLRCLNVEHDRAFFAGDTVVSDVKAGKASEVFARASFVPEYAEYADLIVPAYVAAGNDVVLFTPQQLYQHISSLG